MTIQMPIEHVLLVLIDYLYAMQAMLPHLSRLTLHRCFQRYGISRLPLSKTGESPLKKEFKDYSIGYRHADFTGIQTEENKQYLLVAINRTGKVAFAEAHARATRVVAAKFLRRVLNELSCKVYNMMTNNGI